MNKKPNSIPSAGTKADSEQKDEDLFASQYSSKPYVACSFSSTETKNYSEEIKEAWNKGIGHTKSFINDFGQSMTVTSFNEFEESVCQDDFHKNIVCQLNKKFSVDSSAKL